MKTFIILILSAFFIAFSLIYYGNLNNNFIVFYIGVAIMWITFTITIFKSNKYYGKSK